MNHLEVYAPNATAKPPASYQDAELANRLARPGAAQNLPDKRNIGAGLRAVVFLWLTFDAEVPSALTHKLVFNMTDEGGKSEEGSIDGFNVPIRKDDPLVIAPPFRDGVWVAFNGPSNNSGHRRSMIPLEGRARIPQRFATDWVKLGEDGRPFKGEIIKNENWYGYGMELLAVADATVVAVKDGIPENVPLSPTRVVPITLETVGGNHVILDLGNRRFAFYAHLQPQSVRVKVGDKVRKGQVLGLLGNSGNSDAPHLHLHLGDANSPLATEGLPFVFEAYELLGKTSQDELIGKGVKLQTGATPNKRQREIPLEDQVIRFH